MQESESRMLEPLFAAAGSSLLERTALAAMAEPCAGNEGQRIAAMIESRCALTCAPASQRAFANACRHVHRSRAHPKQRRANREASMSPLTLRRLEVELALIAQKLDMSTKRSIGSTAIIEEIRQTLQSRRGRRPATRLPDAGAQSRSQYAGVEIGRYSNDQSGC